MLTYYDDSFALRDILVQPGVDKVDHIVLLFWFHKEINLYRCRRYFGAYPMRLESTVLLAIV